MEKFGFVPGFAFIFVSVLGPGLECFLLDPRIGYWEFQQKDLFDRIPAWELPLYGWIGFWVNAIVVRFNYE